MKIKTNTFYTSSFVIVLLFQTYISSFKANVLFQLFVLILFFILQNTKISKSFFKTITPIILVFFIGFLATFFNKYTFFTISKDVFHFIKPLIGILIGYLCFKQINDFKLFFKIVILTGFFSAIIHLIALLFFSKAGTVSDLREFSRDNFLELFSLSFLLFYQKTSSQAIFTNTNLSKIVIVVLAVSNVLYFSRTMFVAAIFIAATFYGYTKITAKTIKYLALFLTMVGLFYLYLFSVKIDRSGNSLESFLYKVKIAPSEILKTRIDRNNHKDLWDHWRGYEAQRAFVLMDENPSSYIFGTGYGSLVNLKFFAPLTGNYKDKGLKYISELHNGYVYIFYKLGLLGMLTYLYFLFGLYKKIYTSQGIINVLISAIGLVYLFTTLTISGIYNTKDSIILLLGALLYFDYNSIQKQTLK